MTKNLSFQLFNSGADATSLKSASLITTVIVNEIVQTVIEFNKSNGYDFSQLLIEYGGRNSSVIISDDSFAANFDCLLAIGDLIFSVDENDTANEHLMAIIRRFRAKITSIDKYLYSEMINARRNSLEQKHTKSLTQSHKNALHSYQEKPSRHQTCKQYTSDDTIDSFLHEHRYRFTEEKLQKLFKNLDKKSLDEFKKLFNSQNDKRTELPINSYTLKTYLDYITQLQFKQKGYLNTPMRD